MGILKRWIKSIFRRPARATRRLPPLTEEQKELIRQRNERIEEMRRRRGEVAHA